MRLAMTIEQQQQQQAAAAAAAALQAEALQAGLQRLLSLLPPPLLLGLQGRHQSGGACSESSPAALQCALPSRHCCTAPAVRL
jgi:hypothetical protein